MAFIALMMITVLPGTAGHLEPREILKMDIGAFELWGSAAKRSNPTRMIR